MSRVAFAAAYAALRERFEVEHGDPGRELVADLDGRTAADVARAMLDLVVARAASGEVLVLWPGDGRAERMAVGDLAGDLAARWRPGADDVVVSDPAREWAVLLDHQSCLWAFDARNS